MSVVDVAILTVVTFSVGFLITGSAPLAMIATHFYRHGLDNHACHRECCKWH